jgi:hypothetical protein
MAKLCRSLTIVKHRAITLTSKIGAAGSRRPGGVMVVVLFVFLVLCVVFVALMQVAVVTGFESSLHI